MNRTHDPAVGIMDFLCTDAAGNFVVIETKREAPARAALGQILTYVGWVEQTLCQPGQTVRGLLLVGDSSPALEIAIGATPNVDLYRYTITFAVQAVPPTAGEAGGGA